jgi:hypothetical protein
VIRFINCIKKRDDLSVENFRNYWHSQEFEDLLQRVIDITKAKYFTKNLTLDVEANVMIQEERGVGEPFDGIIEYWWDKGSELMEAYDTDEAKQVRQQMIDYQRQFIDLAASSAFFTESQ